MAIILDADVILRGEKRAFDLTGWLAGRPQDEFEIAAITVAELWHGVERATREQLRRRQNYLALILEPLPVISYTAEIACEHARVWAEVAAAGKMIGYYHLIVASTARFRGSQLATFNRKHLEHIAGLSLVTLPASTLS